MTDFKINNFKNYIYLFNDPQFVGAMNYKGESKNFDRASKKQYPNELWFPTKPEFGPDQSEEDLIDYKDLKQNITKHDGSSAFTSSPFDITIQTNDPGKDPRLVYLLAYSQNAPGTNGELGAQFFQLSHILTKWTSVGKKFFNFSYEYNGEKYVIGLRHISDPNKEKTFYSNIEQLSSFIYNQEVNYRLGFVAVPDKGMISNVGFGGGSAKSQEPAQDFFHNYMLKGIKGNIDTAFYSTKIGVPYDFHEVLSGDINAKEHGVGLKQPSYKKIYNYYDPSYEEAIIKAINEFKITNETVLPSIYDFLYLPTQPDLKVFLYIGGFSKDSMNLASINQFLDNFGKLYSDYIFNIDDSKTITTKDLGVKYPVGGPSYASNLAGMPGAQQGLAGYDSGATTGDDELPSDTATAKDVVELATVYSQFSKLSDDQITSKHKEGVPLWINEFKRGTYFSEKSLNTFNQALDKDFVFPFLIKLDVPVETTGPMADLFIKNDLLDDLNSYVASKITSTDSLTRKYSDYYGGVVNGDANSNFNLLYQLQLNGCKITLANKKPWPKLSKPKLFKNKPKKKAPPSQNQKQLKALADLADTQCKKECEQLADAAVKVLGAKLPALYGEQHALAAYNLWQNTYNDCIAAKCAPPLDVSGAITGAVMAAAGTTASGGSSDAAETTKDPLACEQCEQHAYDILETLEFLSNSPGYWGAWQTIYDACKKECEDQVVPIGLADTQGGLIMPFEDIDDEPVTPIPDMFESAIHIDELTINTNNSVLTYGKSVEELSNLDDVQKLLHKLKTFQFKKDLQNLVFDKVLGPGDIASGKLAHQETLMYEIAKYKVDKDNNETYIQSIFLPMTDKNVLSYYDTQVLPYQNYFYKIFAHKAALASRYKPIKYDEDQFVNFFQDPTPGPGQDPGPQPQDFALKYEIEAYIEIIRVPYYNVAPVNTKTDMLNYSRIEDDPPLPPDVNIVPFRNVNNKLLFLFNNAIDRYEDYPIIIDKNEKEILNQIYIAQNKKPGDKITFKADDSQGTYEIYRTTSLPELYSDFSDPEVKKLMITSIGAEKRDSFIDNILPNTDYYYLFRFVDIHNKYSNPTDVYKVRMIHESGYAPYLKIDVIDFKESQKERYEKNFSSTKKMRKYLYIKPNDRQTLVEGSITELNEVGDDYMDYSYELGDTSLKQSVFGKKLKIRLTSKQTGKKIDINMDVKLPKTIIND